MLKREVQQAAVQERIGDELPRLNETPCRGSRSPSGHSANGTIKAGDD